MLTFLLGNWKLLLIGAIILGCAAAVGYTRIELAHAKLDINTLHEQLGAVTQANANLKAALDTQTAAVKNMETAAATRAEVAKENVRKAAVASKPHQTASIHYLGLQAPQGDSCTNATELIDDYLKARTAAAAGSMRNIPAN